MCKDNSNFRGYAVRGLWDLKSLTGLTDMEEYLKFLRTNTFECIKCKTELLEGNRCGEGREDLCGRCELLDNLSDFVETSLRYGFGKYVINPTVAKILLQEELHKVKFNTNTTLGKNYFRQNCIEDGIYTEEELVDI
jgi:hypothetical protein